MAIYEFEKKKPEIHESAFIYPEAVIIGNVQIGAGVYVGAGAVIRGDWGRIEIGEGSNIQENCVIHARPDDTAVLGPSSHIGHGAILHGPRFGHHVLIGMGAIVHDDVEMGDGVIVASGAVVRQGMKVPGRKVVVGVPARISGDVSDELAKHWEWGTKLYQGLPPRCHESLRKIG